MNTQGFKKIVSLLLVVCILAGFLSLMPTVTVEAAIDTSNSFFLKVGANSALLADGSRMTNLDEPFWHIDSQGNKDVYVPKATLRAIAGSDPSDAAVQEIETATGTVEAVSLSNMSLAYTGWYADRSDMNLIAISETQNFLEGKSDADQVALMKTFLFDAISTSGSQQSVFTSDSKPTVAENHPYLFANQTKFDNLYSVWKAGEAGAPDKTLYFYVEEQVKAAEQLYKRYALVTDGSYAGLNLNAGLVDGHQTALNQIPYYNSYSKKDGYDAGGRLQAAVTHAENIRTLAYAYQVTRDAKFSDLAYDYAYALGQWEHWGPDHFINAADAMGPYATAYDWLYNVWNADPNKSVQTIEEMLFAHGIAPAFYGATQGNSASLWTSKNTDGKDTDGYDWSTRTTNWNAVSSAGVTTAALALYNIERAAKSVGLDTVVDGNYSNNSTFGSNGTHSAVSTDSYQAYCQYLLDLCIYTLPYRGLANYAPDGSYGESNRYWDYATNNVFLMSAALSSATGKDYGILDAWGMDLTVYFALNTMSSDGLSFNYHDSNTTESVSTAWFFYVANEAGLNDRALAAIRRDILENNYDQQQPTFWDALYYWDESVADDLTYPALSHHMQSIQGFALRDSWNPQVGSMYTAFLGGSNNYDDHSQIDSGSFVYYNKGTRWFCDLGTENYNAPGFWYYPFETPSPEDAPTNRGYYYPMTAEGNNCLILDLDGYTTGPNTDYNWEVNHNTFFGQYIPTTEREGGGEITETYSSENGSYAIMDNTSVYKVDMIGDNGGCDNVKETVTKSLADSVKRGILSTNDNKTVVIQDEASFVDEQTFAWIAHMLPTTEVMLSVDGTTAFLSDGKTTIRVKLIDKSGANGDGIGLKFEVKNQDDRFLDSTFAAPEVTGPDAPNDYSAYKKLVVQGTATELKMAIVIEEMIPSVTMNDDEGIGYTFTSMDQWSESTITSDTRPGATEDEEAGITGPVATVTVTKYESVDGPDSPIVDLWSMSSVKSASVALDESEIEWVKDYEALTFSELAKIINEAPFGAKVEVNLNHSNKTPLVLTHECIVNRNGNTLLATSPYFVAMIDGDTVSYEAGNTVTVTFNINGTEYKRDFGASTVVSYDGSTPEKLGYEVSNGIRTYYSWSGWSKVKNGWDMEANQLIVTSENNYFYVAKTPYEGAFVTVKGSTITGYMDGAAFFTSDIRSPDTAFDRIDITNDFYYYAQSGYSERVDKTMNIYLNGHTITYTAAGESMHMFYPSTSNVSLNIYGPGGLNSEARNSNLISGSNNGGATVLIDGVTIHSAYTVIDHRYGNVTFRNCDITVENTCPAFVSTNKDNTVGNNPYVLVDGCTVTMPTTTGGNENAVFAIYSNATIEVTGGTLIKTSVEVPLFYLANQSMSDSGYDFSTGCSNMKAIIGDVNHKLDTVYYAVAYNGVTGTSDGYDSYKPTAAQVFYGNGYKFASLSDISGKNLHDSENVKIVNSGDSDYPYVLSTSYATVYWQNEDGETKHTDYWAAGTVPSPSDEVNTALGVTSGNMLGYTATEVEGGKTYNIITTNMTNIPVKVNMSLQASFQLNFFVLKVDGISGFAIDGGDMVAASEFETIVIDGNTYYKVMKSGISPEYAGANTTLTIYHTSGTLTRAISPIQYVDKALQTDSIFNDVTSRQLLVNILKYSEAAYVYRNRNASASSEYNKVMQMYEKYKEYATVSLVNKQPVSLGAVNHAIHGACININEVPNMRFIFVGEADDEDDNPKTPFTGTVVFTYESYGNTIEKTVTVENGIVTSINGATSGRGIGLGYVDIERKAFDMVNSPISFSVDGGATYSYSLANYYYYAMGDATQIEFINALYSYCETASNYKAAYPNS